MTSPEIVAAAHLPMHRWIKTRWLRRLRSGNVPQPRGRLRRGERHCVLGVLCALHAEATGTPWESSPGSYGQQVFTYLGSHTALPDEVARWAGLPGQPGVYVDPRRVSDETLHLHDLTREGQVTLSQLNDRVGLNFRVLAELIAEQC